jgi:excinuclease UvrABC ATPase subunit
MQKDSGAMSSRCPAYARQFLQLMEKPDVDLIEGLSPAISIEQKATSHNPRSTVGTVTEIHDYLRLLYARVGDPYCPDHPEQKLAAMTISQMVDATLEFPDDTKLMILAPGRGEPQGRAARADGGASRERIRSRARRRQSLRDRRGAEAREEFEAHRSRWWSTG